MSAHLRQPQIDEMRRMQAEGYSIKEIAYEFGCCVATASRHTPIYPNTRGVPLLYPALDRWIWKHHLSITAFAVRVGVSVSSMHNYLTGRVTMSKPVIDKILAATGLTYEEAFRTAE